MRPDDFPAELRDTAATLGRDPAEVEPRPRRAPGRTCTAGSRSPDDDVVDGVPRARRAGGREVRWAGGSGVAEGIDDDGRLLVRAGDELVALDAGEVHLRGLTP